jgi:DNA-binding transcriptional LysR family regulator
VDVEVRHVGLSDPAAGLRSGTDVALVWTPFDMDGLSMRVLRTEPVVALLHRGHPLAGEPGLYREQLRGESIAYPLVPDEVWLEYWMPVPWRHTLRTAGTAASLEGLLSVVASGLGVSFCPASVAAQIPVPQVVAVPLLDGTPCQIAVAWADRNENPLVEGFVATAIEVAMADGAVDGITLP